jgi:hypothetical protein
MNRASLAILMGAFFATGAAVQAQTSAGTSAQASGQASVEANKQGAQASGGASAASSTSAQANGSNASLASGTALTAELNSSVDSKKVKAGDEVVAHTTEAVKSDGKTIIPKGTKLIGHVTQASARAKGDSESAVAIQFDKAILKKGEEMPLNEAIRAIAAEQSNAAAGSGPGLDAMGDAGAAAAGGSPMSGGNRGAVGGATSTAGAAAGSVANTASGVGRTATGAANTAGSVAGSANGAAGGLNSGGQLTSSSRGVFGLNGVNLVTDASSATQGSVITSTGKSVHLDSGTRLLLVSQSEASATPNK